jgi:hypothetical protein
MTPELRRIGRAESPLVVVDGVSGALEEIVDIAVELAPFDRRHGSYYPGLRRVIGQGDGKASAYVDRLLGEIAPLVGGAFDADGFDLIEASFSMVTDRPDALFPAQRAPHFDSLDPDYLAILHYLCDTPGTGTAFYRQRDTGIEKVDAGNVDAFVVSAKRDSAKLSGYTVSSNDYFEQIATVEAAPDRLVIYQGCLLHSGIIPSAMEFGSDPRSGRLTANFFIQAYRGR